MKKKRPTSLWTKSCRAQMIMKEKSLDDVAKETGFSRTYVSTVINDRTVVPAETVQKIGKCLDVDPTTKRIV